MFPDTYSGEAGCDVTEWMNGETPKVNILGNFNESGSSYIAL